MLTDGSRPQGAIVTSTRRDVEDTADFVIVGSGAAGATCARWLTAAGRSVLVVEEGGPARPARGDGFEALATLYRDAGMTRVQGPDSMSILQGRAVGGSTVVGAGVQVPLPEEVWRQWVERDGRWAQRLPWAALESARERLEAELVVTKTPRELWGDTGTGLFQGMLGKAAPTWRNAPACQGAGRCLQGCPHGARTSADLTLLPPAVQRGARVYAQCKVERVLLEQGAATGVQGRFASGHKLVARARVAVILAASALQTPWLLQRSGVRGVGPGLQCHPSASVSGLFHRSTAETPAATQAMHSNALRGEGLELESVVLPRAWQATRVPGIGRALEARLGQLDHVLTWSAFHRAEASGRVRRGPWGPVVQYEPTRRDRKALLKGLAVLAEAMLHAGALEVWPGVYGAPEVVTSVRQARDLALVEPGPAVMSLAAQHFFGGVQVDDRFQAAGVRNLVVADSSLFPSNIGVQPASAVMSVAAVVAERWL